MDKLKESYRRTSIIGVAMLSTLFMYLVVAMAIQTTQDPFEGFAALEDDGLLRNIFLALSLFQVIAIKIIKNRVLSIASTATASAVGGPTDPSRLATLLTKSSIMNFALAESIAVYGLVLFLLNGSSTDFYIFLGLSFLTFVMFFPKYEQWEEVLKGQQGGQA
jgi:F0F1-type ATP synthase membrane subunit c/vacuolar-type H+-ATPase subunit K